MTEDWRIAEILKLLRQCITCPYCGVLVSTQEGLDSHTSWHRQVNEFAQSIDARFQQFADYIINPVTGLQKQIQDRLDTITNYVITPGTGLEPRVFAAIQQLRDDATAAITTTNTSVTTLRNDATTAIGEDRARLSTIENEITRAGNGLRARLTTIETQLGIIVP